jgi:transposase-like protein
MRKPASFYFFKRKPIVPICRDRYELWRGVADLLGFTAQERLRVEWMVFYYTTGKENAALTAKHFGISRKTFHKWSRRFKDSKYNVRSLTDQSKAPRHKQILFIVSATLLTSLLKTYRQIMEVSLPGSLKGLPPN